MGHSGPSQLPRKACGGGGFGSQGVAAFYVAYMWLLGLSLADTAASGSPLWPDLESARGMMCIFDAQTPP